MASLNTEPIFVAISSNWCKAVDMASFVFETVQLTVGLHANVHCLLRRMNYRITSQVNVRVQNKQRTKGIAKCMVFIRKNICCSSVVVALLNVLV